MTILNCADKLPLSKQMLLMLRRTLLDYRKPQPMQRQLNKKLRLNSPNNSSVRQKQSTLYLSCKSASKIAI